MSEEEKRELRISKIQWATILVAVLGFLVAFTGANLQNISLYFSETMFPKADYVVESWTTPTILSDGFRESLSVSPEYFVVTSVSLKSERPYYGEPMQFSLAFDNKGKKSVEQPRILVYFVDYMYRVWNIWNKSAITNDFFAKGCSIEYHFPPMDQKTIGAWMVLVLLYDDAESVLVSYAVTEFMVTDVAPIPWLQQWEIVFSLLMTIVFIGYLIFRFTRERIPKKAESRDRNTQKKERKVKPSLNQASRRV